MWKDQSNYKPCTTATFTMTITRNKLRISICTEYKHYGKIEDGKGDVLSGNWTHDLELHFGKRLFQRPGVNVSLTFSSTSYRETVKLYIELVKQWRKVFFYDILFSTNKKINQIQKSTSI